MIVIFQGNFVVFLLSLTVPYHVTQQSNSLVFTPEK